MNLNRHLDRVTESSFAGFNDNEIINHWNNIIGKPLLEPNETVRLVIMPSATSKMARGGKIATGGWADKTQIRSADDLIVRMRTLQSDEETGAIGFALSAGVYSHIPETSPGYKQLKYIQNMIIDVDAHLNANTKDRFNLTLASNKYIRFSAIHVLNYINLNLKENGLPPIIPVYTAVTGGGYQFCVRFNQPLDAETSRKVFETYGSILGFNYSAGDLISNNTERQKKAKIEQEKETKILQETNAIEHIIETEAHKAEVKKGAEYDTYAHKKKKGINTIVKSEVTGEWFMPFLELDNSFKDCTHAQRIPGTVNQKYDIFAYIDNDLISGENFDELLEEIRVETENAILFDNSTKVQITKLIRSVSKNFKLDILNSNPNCIYTKQDGYAINALSGIIQVANSPERLNGTDFLSLTEVEKQILNYFVDKNDATRTQMLVKNVLMDLGIEIIKDSSTYIACRSPFRTDNNPSLAVYLNHNRANIKDFTEDKSYTLITLWMQINNCSKTEAIEQMSYKYGIEIEKSSKREFEKILNTENVLELIQNVDTTNFIYYRKANKIVDCIWKNLKTSNYEVFNGYKILADHVLINQLGVKHPEKEFREEFQETFLRHVLIDAFERFEPGKEKVVVDSHIKYVNIWSASESYLKCWIEAEKLNSMEIEEALSLIREVCPNIYIYLLQITQRGSLSYFVNWLSCLANFIYVPTLPIFPSIEGAGKNLFVDKVLAPYINEKYINTVNGQALMSNFNAFMGETNLVVIDEGNFTVSKEFDQLKLLTGNNTILVEKKGVDAKAAPKRFNFCMFTNGADPIKHTINDRRCNYYKLDKKLTQTLEKVGIPSVNQFIKNIETEVHKFWGIIIKTKRKLEWEQTNLQNGQYHYQILLTHPFGKLVIKMLENDWDSIYLQLNEKQKELNEEKLNMTLLTQIKDAFYSSKPLSLITINKYLDAMSWKSSVSIQEFISINNLQKNGIRIIIDQESIKLKIDAEVLQKYIYQENNLSEIIPEFSVGPIKTLEQLKQEHEAQQGAKINETTTAGVDVSALNKGLPPGFGGLPGAGLPGGIPAGLPGGLPGTGLPGGIPSGLPQQTKIN